MQMIPDKPIAFNRDFVNLGIGITGALFLSQAIYWSKRTKNKNKWFYKTAKEWEEETGMTRKEQETARKKLKALNIIEEKRKGVPAKLHYRVNYTQLSELLTNKNAQISKSRMYESSNPECTNGANWNARMGQTTTESTSENTINNKKREKKELPNPPLEPSPDTNSNTNQFELSTDEKQNQSSPSPRSSSREQSGRDDHKKKQWLKDIAEGKRPEELFTLCGALDRTDHQVKQSALKALDWLDSNGKRKKDYRAFLRNWVRREYQDKDKQVYKRQNMERERWNPDEVTQGQGLM